MGLETAVQYEKLKVVVGVMPGEIRAAGTTKVSGVTHVNVLSVSVEDQCKEHHVPTASTTCEENSTRLEAGDQPAGLDGTESVSWPNLTLILNAH